jgi:hypothetical protein
MRKSDLNGAMKLNRRSAVLGIGTVLAGAEGTLGRDGRQVHTMVLTGSDSWFRLNVAGYQFPGISNDEWDSNWLIIDGAVRLDGREWRFKEPCLTTFEALRLASWLEGCAQGKTAELECSFTEPNLQFDLIEAHTLRISFALEAKPPWVSPDDYSTRYGFNCPVGAEVLKAASDLRSQLARFPVRGGSAPA